ncbi:single-stranded DNA-binding protein [Gallibacterium sp. AGMB14963]|uniref:single-stranded DNA-binding protein n=1 Tax=Gallibacterium faecale TaxID=3019086 RepID=UPI0022F16E4F|nr:single-stranded DNA-binding protein [Gallibacterium sp. AGMB14963]MDA3978514.1 single-stranded DNA-binding protein [Gallibacterium sp. AGMB14963]
MAGVNKVIIVGNIGNIDVKIFQTGSIANVSVATSENWVDKETQQKKERTEWHRVIFYGRLAEIVQQYLKRGSKIYVEGKLRTRSYESQGVTHYITEIIGEQLQMLSSKEPTTTETKNNHQAVQTDDCPPFPV